MSEEERSEDLFGKAPDTEEEVSSDKETKVSSEEAIEVKKVNYRFKPKIKIDSDEEYFPFCIVWTPLPCVTWFLPSIGHVGIGDTKGKLRDYIYNFEVNESQLAFGRPTKYLILEMDGREVDEYDEAILKAKLDYKKLEYNFFTNNCHSFVARCLNHLKYKGKTNYTMVHVWWMLTLKGRYVNCKRFLKTYCGFLVFLLIIAAIVIPCILFIGKK